MVKKLKKKKKLITSKLFLKDGSLYLAIFGEITSQSFCLKAKMGS